MTSQDQPAPDRPASVPAVQSITRSFMSGPNGENHYMIWFAGESPTAESLRDLIMFIERNYPGVALELTEMRSIMHVFYADDEDSSLLRWLQINLEPEVPYVGAMIVPSLTENRVEIHMFGRTDAEVMAAMEATLGALDGLTFVRTEGTVLHFTVVSELVEEPYELVMLVQGGQSVATITTRHPLG